MYRFIGTDSFSHREKYTYELIKMKYEYRDREKEIPLSFSN
jgi:hypothetical protein